MKKVIKYILIVILFLFIVLVGVILRKYFIIHKIENNLLSVENYSNYSIKMIFENWGIGEENWTQYRGFNEKKITDSPNVLMFKDSDNKIYQLLKKENNYFYIDMTQETQPSILMEDNYNRNKYFIDITENEQSNIEQLKLALRFKIKTEDYRGKECYAISYKWVDESVNVENLTTLYIDKNSLFMVASELIQPEQSEDKYITLYEIEYNTQKEEEFSKDIILDGYTQV